MSDTQATGDVALDTTPDTTTDTTPDTTTDTTSGATDPTDPTADSTTDPTDTGIEAADEGATDDGDAAPAAADETGKPDRSSRVRQLEREGEVAADFLETLLDIADLDGDLDVDVDGDRAAVAIVDSEDGRVPRRLVGPNGKVLEALQELTRLAVQAETGERSRLMLDIAGHRAERRSTLVDLAKTAIEQVKATGEKSSLEPMSAFERKVVHDEVAAAGLVSESEGTEPHRHVVILPA
jgi:spoIIIJ-associated protein